MADPVIKSGALVQIAVTFTNAATPPVPTNPTAVTFVWSVVDEATRSVFVAGPTTIPNGDVRIVNSSAGNFQVNVDVTGLVGLLLWKFTGTGQVQQIWDGQLVIRKPAV